VRSGLTLLLALSLMGSGRDAAPALTTAARGIPSPVLVSAGDDQVTVDILELFCRKCAEEIIANCKDIVGVTAVDVDRKDKTLTLHFASGVTSRDRVLADVDAAVASIP
jgi:copper chaperone CopZ